MTPILDTVKAFFETDQWAFYQVPGQPFLFVEFQGKNGQWKGLAQVDDEHAQFVFYSISPISAPQRHVASMAEFLTRANFGMLIGNFEIDLEDGQIRFKTSIDVEGSQLDAAMVKRLVYTNVLTMDKYLPGIQAIINDDVGPEEAIAQIEDSL